MTEKSSESQELFQQDKNRRSQQFHDLWSQCVGTPSYNKQDWINIQTQLVNAGLIGS